MSILTVCLSIFLLLSSCGLEALSMKWAVSARQGSRETMEDRSTMAYDNKTGRRFFGVYDGHGGTQAVDFTEQNLHKEIMKAPTLKSNVFTRAFIEIDKQILDKNYSSGTTAVVAVLDQLTLYLAWAGDSRAVLARNDKVVISTKDHKPRDEKEKNRIEKAGCYVDSYDRVTTDYLSLAVSRAIGDYPFKEIGNQYSPKNMAVIAYPDVTTIKLRGNESFLILASDGFWDKFTNEEAITLAIKFASNNQDFTKDSSDKKMSNERGNCNSMKMIARALRDAAYNNGSSDNITVLIIKFEWN